MSKVKALLLCGGFARRLEPITYFIPKSLLPSGINGKPVIEYIYDDVIASGITDVLLSTNSKFESSFRSWATQKNAMIDFVIEQTNHHNEKLGALGGIAYAIKTMNIDTDLLIIAGDNLYDFSVKDIIAYFEKHRKPTIAFYDIGSKEQAKNFGVAKLRGNMAVSFHEKPANPESTLVSTAIYLFPKEHLGKFEKYIKKTNNSDNIGDFITWLIDDTEVHGFTYKGKWYDIGTPDTYKKAFEEASK